MGAKAAAPPSPASGPKRKKAHKPHPLFFKFKKRVLFVRKFFMYVPFV